LNRLWFTRAWIIQEAALCPRSLIRLGEEVFDWRLLDLFIIAMGRVEQQWFGLSNLRTSKTLKTRGAATTRHVQYCRKASISRRMEEQHDDFLYTLKRLAFSVESSDARDLVFAFLSLQGNKNIMKADYTLSVEEVYTSISAILAERSESLAIFGWTRFNQVSELPSWVVDWRLNKSTQGSPFGDTGSGFFASKSFKYKARPRSQIDCLLEVSGTIIDSIGTLSGIQHHLRPSDSNPKDLLQLDEVVLSFSNSSRRMCSQLETDEHLHRRILKVLLAEDHRSSHSDAHWDKVLDGMVQSYHSYDQSSSTPPTNAELDIRRKLIHLSRTCLSKTVFMSQTQRIFGLAPRIAQSGDLICILHGSKVPVLLRKSGKCCLVVGQCYFEGYMYGELVDWEEHDADVFKLE
jgi:hypothetical protein